jgi:hypothetical protein
MITQGKCGFWNVVIVMLKVAKGETWVPGSMMGHILLCIYSHIVKLPIWFYSCLMFVPQTHLPLTYTYHRLMIAPMLLPLLIIHNVQTTFLGSKISSFVLEKGEIVMGTSWSLLGPRVEVGLTPKVMCCHKYRRWSRCVFSSWPNLWFVVLEL